MHQLAIDEVNRLAPYEAGNRPLWLIHKLDILDKHRLLITAGQANMAAFAPEGCKIVSPGGGLAILNEGDKIFTVEGLKLNDKVNFVIDVALNEPNLVSPSPLYLILNYSVMEVRHIIRNFGRFVK